ncbi:MAG: hypothetical protein ACTSYB_02305 [Candidatus Helarchaeota archaeon]
MPDIDVKNFILNGPEILMQNLVQMSQIDKSATPLSFTKVLRTFILNTELKGEISTSGSSGNKVSGIIEWIGERKDGNKGIELFLRSRSGNKVFIFGENVQTASFNPQKLFLAIQEIPEQCPICKSAIAARDEIIQCPACGVKAHKDHFLEYIKIHGTCPKCQKRLSMKAKNA